VSTSYFHLGDGSFGVLALALTWVIGATTWYFTQVARVHPLIRLVRAIRSHS
jgi:hypothetical protein